MSKKLRGMAAFAAAAVAISTTILVSAGSASALATAVWVGTAHASAPGNSCTHPGYNSIQAGLNAVANNGTVHVCGGRYVEQVQITRGVTVTGTGSPVIALPSTPADSTTSCETSIVGFQPDQDGVAVCTSGTVRISNVAIDAAWPDGTCYDSMYGLFAAGGVNLILNFVTVTAAGPRTINGCQGGIGIQVGSTRTTPNLKGKLTMTNSAISGYQKNGINIVGTGTTGKVTTTSVTGAGATEAIAQNGIEVAGGAVGTLSGDTIADNECAVESCGPNPLTDTQSTGVLLFGAAQSSSVANNTLITNDIGVYYSADPAAAAPKLATVIRGNRVTDNRYEGICLDQGLANVTGNTYSGGNIGLSVIQYDGQTFGASYTASNENHLAPIGAAVEIDSDNAEGDQPGKVTLSNITTHGGPIVNNSSTITLVEHGIH